MRTLHLAVALLSAVPAWADEPYVEIELDVSRPVSAEGDLTFTIDNVGKWLDAEDVTLVAIAWFDDRRRASLVSEDAACATDETLQLVCHLGTIPLGERREVVALQHHVDGVTAEVTASEGGGDVVDARFGCATSGRASGWLGATVALLLRRRSTRSR